MWNEEVVSDELYGNFQTCNSIILIMKFDVKWCVKWFPYIILSNPYNNTEN